jgi:hypothetical protein
MMAAAEDAETQDCGSDATEGNVPFPGAHRVRHAQPDVLGTRGEGRVDRGRHGVAYRSITPMLTGIQFRLRPPADTLEYAVCR